jgi:hypothetical protein
VVRHLAHEHQVHRFLAERRRAGASHRARHSAVPGKAGSHAAPLEADRQQPEAAPCAPARGGARQVAEAGAEVGECQGGARRHPGQGAGQPVPDGGRAAEPAVRAGDVAQRLGDRAGIGGRIVEQLGADGAQGQGLAGHARLVYPPRK